MPSFTCIVCPIGCLLTVEEGPSASAPGAAGDERPLVVSGNRCLRGAVYAREEVRAPKRVVTATCGLATEPEGGAGGGTELAERGMGTELTERRAGTELTERRAGTELYRPFPVSRRVPVKSSVPCPKEKIPELLRAIYQVRLSLPVKMGDVVISNWQGLGIDIIAARTLE